MRGQSENSQILLTQIATYEQSLSNTQFRHDGAAPSLASADRLDGCEYFFRGAPYGAMLLVVWEVFKPLQNPGTPLNLVNIGWACLMLLISLVCLWLISKKAYLVAYKDGYDICCDGRLEVVNHLRQLPMSFFNSRDPGDIGAYIVSDITTWRCSLLTLSVSSLAGWRCPSSLWFRSHSSTGN